MRLYPSVTFKCRIHYHNRTSNFCSRSKEKKIIASDIAVIEEQLLSTSINIRRLCSTNSWKVMNNGETINSNFSACNTNAVYGIKYLNVLCPRIAQAAHSK